MEKGILPLIYNKNDNTKITFLKPRADSSYLNINIKKWQERKNNEQEKLNDVINFIQTTDQCRSAMLLSYFGESNMKNCDKCDCCIKQKRKNLKEPKF